MQEREIYSAQEFRKMIDDLYGTIGVRMEIADNGRFDRIDTGNFLSVCKIMLDYMELPVALRPRFTSQFDTRTVVKNEAGTIRSIAAQVAFPQDGTLPWHRSERMEGYPIPIAVDPEAFGNPYVVLTQLSHEFSHVYLHSRRDPWHKSEHATDLCALMMGFSPFWAKGRRTSTPSHMLTQGYLSDEEYAVASRTIRDLRADFRRLCNEVRRVLPGIQSAKSRLEARLEELAQRADFHYRHPQGVLTDPSDAGVFAELAQPYFRAEKEELVARSLARTNEIVRALNRKRDFFETDKAWLNGLIAELKTVCATLQRADAEVMHRIRVVIRNTDVPKYDARFRESVAAIRADMAAIGALRDAVRARSARIGLARAVYADHRKKAAPSPEEQYDIRCAGDREVSRLTDDMLTQACTLLREVEGELDGRQFFSITEERLAELKRSTEEGKARLERMADRQAMMSAALGRNTTFVGRMLLFWRRLTAKG